MGDGSEKTEKPTPKKKADMRKEGNVFKSQDVITVGMLFGVFGMMKVLLPGILKNIKQFLVLCVSGALETGTPDVKKVLHMFTVMFLKSALPLLLVTVVLAVITTGAQTRFLVTFKNTRFKLSKLSVLKGLKRMFALKNLVEMGKNLLKITLLGFIVKDSVAEEIGKVSKMLDMGLEASMTVMFSMIFGVVMRIGMAFLVIAFVDFLYQRWKYQKDLMMTKQEVKDEYKQIEGNPEIKGRIRNLQRKFAMSRMMQQVPEADLVIKNPTHFAVALKYDEEKGNAPVVVAKGCDALALRIIKKAEESGVFVMENRPLARALYADCAIQSEISPEFYSAVAEILVYLYRVKKKKDK